MWVNVVEFKIFFILLHSKNVIIFQMSNFIGNHKAKTDAKGRVFIPAAYRKMLPAGQCDRLVMRKDADTDCLVIYPEPVWQQKTERLMSALDEWNSDDQLLLMQFVSDAEWLDIDAQGRVLINKKYLQSIGVENNEVVFVGMINRFAIWARDKYENSKLSKENFATQLKSKMMQKTEK